MNESASIQSKIPHTQITADALRADGWRIHEMGEMPQVYPYLAEKNVENRNPLNNSSDSDIKLIIHRLYNSDCFAILLPDGGMLNFTANSMEELKNFERAIVFYDPPF